MLVGAVIGLLPFIPVAFSPVRSLRRLPESDE
jgi:hypothetical protein